MHKVENPSEPSELARSLRLRTNYTLRLVVHEALACLAFITTLQLWKL